MKLYELRKEIIDSYSDFWHRIDGPIYDYNLGTSNGHAHVFGWHDRRYVMQHDLDISLNTGMPLRSIDRDYSPEWASMFADVTVTDEYADILYRGAVVDRVTLANVDGARAVLPIPHMREGRWTVMDWEYQVARLVDDLEGRSDFNQYMERSGIYKWPA